MRSNRLGFGSPRYREAREADGAQKPQATREAVEEQTLLQKNRKADAELNPILKEKAENEERDREPDGPKTLKTTGELSSEERLEVRKLKAEDRRVRAQLQAKLGTAGNLSEGAAQLHYVTGPDGRKYVVDGDISFDTRFEDDPARNLDKARRLQVTALAGSGVESADPALSALARRMALAAYAELNRGSVPNLQPAEQLDETPAEEL
jgi:hypothetical protein